MEEFRGTVQQYDLLRDNIRTLYEIHGIKSGVLEGHVWKVAARLKVKDPMTRQDIDKFRRGKVTRPKGLDRVSALWQVVFSGEFSLPTAQPNGSAASPSVENNSGDGHEFYRSAVAFFNVHKQRNEKLLKLICGRYRLYHYSELFYRHSKAIDKAVVLAQMDIVFDKESSVITVSERQSYDGRLGPPDTAEYSTGYCIPKNISLSMILKDSADALPKFYVFSQRHDDPRSNRASWMRGYMLKPSDEASPLFHFYSPVYAVRVADDEEIDCNILQLSEVDHRIVSELNKGQVVAYRED